jgi:thermitase
MRTPLFLLIDAVARDELQPPRPDRPKPRKSKTKKIAIAALAAAAAVAAPVGIAHADAKPAATTAPAAHGYVPGQMIVKFREGQRPAARTAALRAHGARIDHTLWRSGPVLVSVPPDQPVSEAVKAMERDPRVEYAEPNAYRRGDALPNDALFADEGYLPSIHAPEAWDRTTGSPSVKVAVVDSGVALGEPDLAPNQWKNPGESGGGKESNGVDDDGNGFVDDWRGWDFVQGDNEPSDNAGHGTQVASVLASRGGDGVGVAGTAWNASIVPVRVLDNTTFGTCDEIAAGMAYAVKVGARIVNVSVGGFNDCHTEGAVIAAAPDVLFVMSAGNAGVDVDQKPTYPCADPFPNVICVTGTDGTDKLWEHSNFGAQNVDIAAPATQMLVPKLKFENAETVFSDGFESPLTQVWFPLGTPNTWERTKSHPHSGSFALTDSPQGNYANNTDNYVYLLKTLDLTGKHNCYASAWIDLELSPTGVADENDYLRTEASPDGVNWDLRPDESWGVTKGYQQWGMDLSELEGRLSLGRFRFRLITDGATTHDGVYVDDFKVLCIPPVDTYTGVRDEFAASDGTSFSVPQVSGVAALMLSLDPSLTATELKQRLMSSADPLPSLAGKTVSGGRLNAAKAVATIPVSPGTPATPATSPLAADLRALVKKLRIRALLGRRGFVTSRVHAPGAGRLTLVLKSGKRTVATGSRSVKRAGAYPLRIKATRKGRSLLRHSRRLQLTVELRFKPRTGKALVESTKAGIR